MNCSKISMFSKTVFLAIYLAQSVLSNEDLRLDSDVNVQGLPDDDISSYDSFDNLPEWSNEDLRLDSDVNVQGLRQSVFSNEDLRFDSDVNVQGLPDGVVCSLSDLPEWNEWDIIKNYGYTLQNVETQQYMNHDNYKFFETNVMLTELSTDISDWKKVLQPRMRTPKNGGEPKANEREYQFRLIATKGGGFKITANYVHGRNAEGEVLNTFEGDNGPTSQLYDCSDINDNCLLVEHCKHLVSNEDHSGTTWTMKESGSCQFTIESDGYVLWSDGDRVKSPVSKENLSPESLYQWKIKRFYYPCTTGWC